MAYSDKCVCNLDVYMRVALYTHPRQLGHLQVAPTVPLWLAATHPCCRICPVSAKMLLSRTCPQRAAHHRSCPAWTSPGTRLHSDSTEPAWGFFNGLTFQISSGREMEPLTEDAVQPLVREKQTSCYQPGKHTTPSHW